MDKEIAELAQKYGPWAALVVVVAVGRLNAVSGALGRLTDAWIDWIRARTEAIRARTDRDRSEALLNSAVLRQSHAERAGPASLPGPIAAGEMAGRAAATDSQR